MIQVGMQIIIGDNNPVSLSKSLRIGKKVKKIGRNDPCPCGSGKNIKNAVGYRYVSESIGYLLHIFMMERKNSFC